MHIESGISFINPCFSAVQRRNRKLVFEDARTKLEDIKLLRVSYGTTLLVTDQQLAGFTVRHFFWRLHAVWNRQGIGPARSLVVHVSQSGACHFGHLFKVWYVIYCMVSIPFFRA
jgi:hypothetical protein